MTRTLYRAFLTLAVSAYFVAAWLVPVNAGGFGPAQGTNTTTDGTTPVAGPSSSVDSYVAVFSGTTGKVLDDRPVTVASTGQVSWPTGLGAITHVEGPTDQALTFSGNATNGSLFRAGGSTRFAVGSGGLVAYSSFWPATDANRDLGTSSLRWGSGYFSGTVDASLHTATASGAINAQMASSGSSGVFDLDSGGALRWTSGATATSAKDASLHRSAAGVLAFGSGNAEVARIPGVLTRSVTSAQTGANTDETTLWSYSLPAGTLASDGQAVRIKCWGSFGANANNKTVRLKFGGTTLVSVTTGANGTNWSASGSVFRTGATAQIGFADFVNSNGLAPSTSVTPAETLANAITIALTGQNGTANAGDIVFKGAIVEFLP